MVSTWNESLETGNELIDRQHRELIGLLDALTKTTDESEAGLLSLLDQLMAFTIFHFIAEEDLMDEVGYPSGPKKEMCDQHQEFKDYARLRVMEFRMGALASIESFGLFVEDFLKVHEFGLDLLLADWIRLQEGRPDTR